MRPENGPLFIWTHVPFDYIEKSQESWKRLHRGRVSRPRELPMISHALDASMKHMFAEYIPQDRPVPIMVWSILRDEPLDQTFSSKIRTPPEILREDEHAYTLGIYQINEWATDYATRYWFAHAGKHMLLRQMQAVYAEVSTLQSRLNASRTYRFMDRVEYVAKERGRDFHHAVFSALFTHDFSHLDDCVREANIGGCHSVNELALFTGKKQGKTSLTKLFLSLHSESKNPVKRGIKRTLVSIMTGGVHEEPGIIYIHLAPPILESFFVGGMGAGIDLFVGMGAGVVAGGLVGALLAYVGVHETIHEYSTGRRFKGLIPLTMKM